MKLLTCRTQMVVNEIHSRFAGGPEVRILLDDDFVINTHFLLTKDILLTPSSAVSCSLHPLQNLFIILFHPSREPIVFDTTHPPLEQLCDLLVNHMRSNITSCALCTLSQSPRRIPQSTNSHLSMPPDSLGISYQPTNNLRYLKTRADST